MIESRISSFDSLNFVLGAVANGPLGDSEICSIVEQAARRSVVPLTEELNPVIEPVIRAYDLGLENPGGENSDHEIWTGGLELTLLVHGTPIQDREGWLEYLNVLQAALSVPDALRSEYCTAIYLTPASLV